MMLEKAVEKTVLPQGHLIILNDLHQQREFSSLNGIAGVQIYILYWTLLIILIAFKGSK